MFSPETHFGNQPHTRDIQKLSCVNTSFGSVLMSKKHWHVNFSFIRYSPCWRFLCWWVSDEIACKHVSRAISMHRVCLEGTPTWGDYAPSLMPSWIVVRIWLHWTKWCSDPLPFGLTRDTWCGGYSWKWQAIEYLPCQFDNFLAFYSSYICP